MNVKSISLLLTLLLLVSSVRSQKKGDMTENERASSNFIIKFLKTLYKEHVTYTDSSNSKANNDLLSLAATNLHVNTIYNFSEYILIADFDRDTAKALFNKQGYIQREIKDLADFISRKSLHFIGVRPLRLSKDNYIYSKLTTFQKENTFFIFDTRSPDDVLFYILLIPGKSIGLSYPKIFSWKLEFSFGVFFLEM